MLECGVSPFRDLVTCSPTACAVRQIPEGVIRPNNKNTSPRRKERVMTLNSCKNIKPKKAKIQN